MRFVFTAPELGGNIAPRAIPFTVMFGAMASAKDRVSAARAAFAIV